MIVSSYEYDWWPEVQFQHGLSQDLLLTRPTRRSFLQIGASGFAAAALDSPALTAQEHVMEKSGRLFRFVQIDVFSSKRLEGNPLAVFLDARGLSDAEMQALARETNLSETTFVIPREPSVEREQGVKVRIFVPEMEIPFAGQNRCNRLSDRSRSEDRQDSRHICRRWIRLSLRRDAAGRPGFRPGPLTRNCRFHDRRQPRRDQR